jgi:hypothetical protein
MKVATTISHSMALIQFFKAQLPDLKSPPPACYTVRMPPKTTLGEIGEMLAHVVKHMATKDDLAELKRELKGDILTVQQHVTSIERQLRETKTEVRLGDLEEKVFGAARR